MALQRTIRKKGFRDKKVPRSIEQNLDVPRGRQVTLGDLMKYGRGACASCKGKGARMVEATRGQALTWVPCACATKRMFKAHPELIIEASGQAWWPFKAGDTSASPLIP